MKKRLKKYKAKYFDVYKAECHRLQSVLNLGDWDISYELSKSATDAASTTYDCWHRIATLQYNDNVSVRKAISDARHEMFHLLLADLTTYYELGKDGKKYISTALERLSTLAEKLHMVRDDA